MTLLLALSFGGCVSQVETIPEKTEQSIAPTNLSLDTATLLIDGLVDLGGSDPEYVRDLYEKILDSDPENFIAWYYLGWLERDHFADSKAAIVSFQNALESAPHPRQATFTAYAIGRIHSENGDSAEALASFSLAKTLAEQWVTNEPQDGLARETHLDMISKAAVAASEVGDYLTANELFVTGISTAREQLGQDSENESARVVLLNLLNNFSVLQMLVGEDLAARDLSIEAAELARIQIAANPNDSFARKQFFTLLARRVNSENAVGDSNSAFEASVNYLNEVDTFLNLNPEDQLSISHFNTAKCMVGFAAADLEKVELAIDSLRTCREAILRSEINMTADTDPMDVLTLVESELSMLSPSNGMAR